MRWLATLIALALVVMPLRMELEPTMGVTLTLVALADEGDNGGGDGDGGDGDGGDGDSDGGDGDGDDGGGDSDGGDGGEGGSSGGGGAGSGGAGSGNGGSGGGGNAGGNDGGNDGGADGGTDGGDGPSERGATAGETDVVTDFFQRLFGSDRDIVEDEVVALTPEANGTVDLAALQAAGFELISEHELAGLRARVFHLRSPPGLDAEDAAGLAAELAPEALVDLNDLYRGGGIGCQTDCWGADLVRIPALRGNACARGAPIAMIDTAVATGHPALRRARITQQSFIPPAASPAPMAHGTAIATLLVGESAPGAAPLAPGARLLAAETFRLIDGEPKADTIAILRGLDWSVRNRARVIAMSLEGAPNTALGFAVGRSAERANLVAAAGNKGASGDPAYPAAYPEVVAVAAVDARLRPYRNGTRGGYVEISAPGVAVSSAASGGAWTTWSGSSFAVPFVAAALLRARAETRGDAAAARDLLRRTALDLGAPGLDEVYGHGLLQAPEGTCW